VGRRPFRDLGDEGGVVTSTCMQALALPGQPTSLRSDVVTVRFEGALDALTVGDLRRTIVEVLAGRPRNVTVDLGRVTLLDSSGVGAIVSLFKQLRAQGGKVRVVGAQGQPLAVLRLLKLDTIFGS
jgi:anti-sigma B factor antagonist